ncbi:MAG: hypothetical protein D6778_07195 [Nitrospirae bacterium]|nr:MAG: hypothetical protein D6778_07195 [Nitrospirota bacterium]
MSNGNGPSTVVWIIIAALVGIIGFGIGYSISKKTGTEPGYFEAVEAAGYGGGSELEGLSEEAIEYLKQLQGGEE